VGDARVTVLSPLPAAAVVVTWPTGGPAHSVAFGPDGAVYVGEEGRIELFDAPAAGAGEVAAPKLRATWTDAARLGQVTALAGTADGVFAGDAAGRCIRRLDNRGQWQADIGADNRMRGFVLPNGHLDFALDGEGVLHALNPGQHRVQRFDGTGKLLGHWGRFDGRDAEGFPGCCNPTNIALLPGGDIVVTEKAGPRVKVYSREGKLRAHFGAEDFDPNCRNMDVATDAGGRIYVVDTERLHIVVYEPAATTRPAAAAEPTATPGGRGGERT
ncbi:MAG: hypothetical protein AB1716_07520, partial [Planctomycetota bacterium]